MNRIQTGLTLALFGLSATALAADGEKGSSHGIGNLDTDHDGVVSFAEFQVTQIEALARLDTDENGVLTVDELINAQPGFRGRGNPQDRPHAGTGEDRENRRAEMRARMQQLAVERFEAMDADGNDMVSLEEFEEANFFNLDTDNNGLISREELRSRRRGGPAGHGRPRGQ